MRTDRTLARGVKLGLLLAALSLLTEGLVEAPRLTAPYLDPPSVPGASKIIEHFAVQHLAFVALALSLVFAPLMLRRLFQDPFSRWFWGLIAVALVYPEFGASFQNGDLFRAYPFATGLADEAQTVAVGALTLNWIQATHLLFVHVLLLGAIILLAVRPDRLTFFAGPRTGEARLSA